MCVCVCGGGGGGARACKSIVVKEELVTEPLETVDIFADKLVTSSLSFLFMAGIVYEPPFQGRCL